MTIHQPIARPQESEYHAHFGEYIRLVPEGDLLTFLDSQLGELASLCRGLNDQQALTRHAPYTWTIKQVIGHISDCERVFGHRVLWIARGDSSPLKGFDETAFMQSADFDRLPLGDLLDEFAAVRKSHLHLLRHMPPDAWTRCGTVSDHVATPRAFAYVIGGHAEHHLDILHKRLTGRPAK